MNNKQLACVLLLIVIICCFQGGRIMMGKMTAAREAQASAEAALKNSTSMFAIKQNNLVRLKQETAALRQYLSRWKSKFEETDDQTKAHAVFSRIYKQNADGLVSHADKNNIVSIKDAHYIPQRYQKTLAVEGDYGQAIGLVGQIERQMPASRISSLAISKGTRGNDVKLSLTVDTPMIAKAGAISPVTTPAKK